ncbi:hypothetical protein HID58_004660, partial [Brassica napus]
MGNCCGRDTGNNNGEPTYENGVSAEASVKASRHPPASPPPATKQGPIAGCLSEEEIMGLKEMFKGMDTDDSGTITLEELRQGLAKQGTRYITMEELEQALREFGMNDGRDIKEIISEVDGD